MKGVIPADSFLVFIRYILEKKSGVLLIGSTVDSLFRVLRSLIMLKRETEAYSILSVLL